MKGKQMRAAVLGKAVLYRTGEPTRYLRLLSGAYRIAAFGPAKDNLVDRAVRIETYDRCTPRYSAG